MGNRSRYVAATTAVGTAALLSARRRARLRRAMGRIGDTILPTHVADLPTEPSVAEDEAHAPGHRHLGGQGTRRSRRSEAAARRRFAPGMRQRTPDR